MHKFAKMTKIAGEVIYLLLSKEVAIEAHAILERGENRGKVVLTVD